MAKTLVACPRCGKQVEWTPASKYRPFCSERCKTLDLGAWANEEYKIAGGQTDDDSEPDLRNEPPAS